MGMTGKVDIGPVRDESEVLAYAEIVRKALFFPGADPKEWARREGHERIQVARSQGKVVGGLVSQPMGMWVGGREVACSAIRAVAVSAEARGSGVAVELMRAVLAESRDTEQPLSVLFPATQPVYRRAGYEQAGVRIQYRLATKGIVARDRGLRLRPIEAKDREAIADAYAQRARRTCGNLARSGWFWSDRLFDPPPWRMATQGYLVERDGAIEGYVIFGQRSGGWDTHKHEMDVVDLVVLTPEAGRRLLTFFADHRSMVASIRFCAAPADPLFLLLAEQEAIPIGRIDWMLRIVDTPGALAGRGYAASVTAEVHLEVRDELLDSDTRRLVLRVADGRGLVEPGGRGDLKIGVRGLAALYTGHFSPEALKAAGYLDGDVAALAQAGAVFAGPAPWMPDIF